MQHKTWTIKAPEIYLPLHGKTVFNRQTVYLEINFAGLGPCFSWERASILHRACFNCQNKPSGCEENIFSWRPRDEMLKGVYSSSDWIFQKLFIIFLKWILRGSEPLKSTENYSCKGNWWCLAPWWTELTVNKTYLRDVSFWIYSVPKVNNQQNCCSYKESIVFERDLFDGKPSKIIKWKAFNG